MNDTGSWLAVLTALLAGALVPVFVVRGRGVVKVLGAYRWALGAAVAVAALATTCILVLDGVQSFVLVLIAVLIGIASSEALRKRILHVNGRVEGPKRT